MPPGLPALLPLPPPQQHWGVPAGPGRLLLQHTKDQDAPGSRSRRESTHTHTSAHHVHLAWVSCQRLAGLVQLRHVMLHGARFWLMPVLYVACFCKLSIRHMHTTWDISATPGLAVYCLHAR